MNSKQLRKYRKNFYVNLENFIKENNSLTMEDYHIIIGKTISQCEKEIKTSKKVYVYMGTYKKTEEELSLIDEIDENDDYGFTYNGSYWMNREVDKTYINPYLLTGNWTKDDNERYDVEDEHMMWKFLVSFIHGMIYDES